MRLLAQNVGLLAADIAVQTGQASLLPCQIAVHVGSVLLQSCQLCRSPDLARACVGELLSRLEAHLPLGNTVLTLQCLVGQVGLLLELCVLQSSLKAGLLVHACGLQSSLLVHALCLQSVCGILQVSLRGQLSVGCPGSQGVLLVGHGRLESCLLVHALCLQAVGFVLHVCLLGSGQVGQSCLQARLGLELLRVLLRCQILLAHSKTCLLVGHGRLQCLLGIHALSLQLCCLVLHVGLLRRRQVGQGHLQVCPKTQLLRGLLSAQVLGAHSESGLLVCLLGREPRLLLRVELLLCRSIALLQTFSLNVCLELCQIAGSLGFDNTLARTAKRAGADCGGVTALAGDVILALSFAQRDVGHRLLVRGHVLLRGSRSSD